MNSSPSLLEQLGGTRVLEKIIHDFVGRVFDDIMIGYLFRKVDRSRLERLESQLAAQFLGAPVNYQGRPLDKAHASHRIMGGQFARRKQILSETLQHHQVPETIQKAWLEHTESLRSQITADSGGNCSRSE
ncbi:MAG: group 1 truncated hemoglobin [Planctomycetota bacterium]|nr:group 1 truncated hemoglobin [Planctomycetota bacterium]